MPENMTTHLYIIEKNIFYNRPKKVRTSLLITNTSPAVAIIRPSIMIIQVLRVGIAGGHKFSMLSN